MKAQRVIREETKQKKFEITNFLEIPFLRKVQCVNIYQNQRIKQNSKNIAILFSGKKFTIKIDIETNTLLTITINIL